MQTFLKIAGFHWKPYWFQSELIDYISNYCIRPSFSILGDAQEEIFKTGLQQTSVENKVVKWDTSKYFKEPKLSMKKVTDVIQALLGIIFICSGSTDTVCPPKC